MNANPKLRKWLNHKPRPAYMHCDDTRVDAPATDRGWAEVAESIEYLAPQHIRCFSGDGRLLRAKPFAYFFPVDELAGDESPAAPASSSAALPPEQAVLAQFATLIASAHNQAGANHAPIMQHAMELIRSQAEEASRLRAENEKLRAVVARLQADLAQAEAELSAPQVPAAAPDGGLVGGIVQGFLASQAGDGSVTPIKQPKGAK